MKWRWFKNLCAYINIVICKDYKGYKFQKWSKGNGYTSYGAGFEIINPKTNKVVYRKGKYTTNLDDSRCDWEEINIFFKENLL